MTRSPTWSGAPLYLLQTTRTSGQHVNMPKKYPSRVEEMTTSNKSNIACQSDTMAEAGTPCKKNRGTLKENNIYECVHEL